MGTGKTKAAGRIAEKLGMKYVSTDSLIEEKEGVSISDIFDRKGEAYFRRLEKEAVKEVSGSENTVIDAGGGAVIDPENVKNLKKKGVIVCLWADAEVIFERTKKFTHRPLLRVKDPLAKIRDLLSKRKPFYERADHHVNTRGMSIEQVAAEIEEIVRNA